MAQRSCCVPGCSMKLGGGLPLHRFPNPNNPAQIERFRTWVMKIGGDIIGEDNNFIHKNRKVCHKHFQDIYILPNKKITALAIPTLAIPGVHVGERRLIELPSTSLQMETAISTSPVPMDTDISSRTVMNIEMPLQMETAISTQPVQMDTAISSRPVMNIEMPLQMETAISIQPVQMDTAISSRPVINIEMPLQTDTAVSTGPVQMDTDISLNPGCYKNSIPLTATEKKLKDIISEVKAKLRKARNTNKKLRLQMLMAEKIMKSSAYQMVKEKLTPAAQTFFAMQIKQFAKKPAGRRFTLDEKVLCLSLYKPSPRAYRILGQMCILPKRKTLEKLLYKINLQPGINKIIFEHLKRKVEKMPTRHKYCCLIFDEMAIAPNLSYDKTNDIIHGFIDNGEERSKIFCDHVCVFMIRGICKKYKQPISFSFCKGSSKTADLCKQLKSIIHSLNDIGLNVVATVCDQGATNMAALNLLMKATEGNYLRCGKNYLGGFFEIDSKKIYPIYDPPHLIKGVRNNLLTKDLQFKEDGKTKLASWSHIEALYKRGPKYRGVKLMTKLTAEHVYPQLIPKMRVKHCTQVFSNTVGLTMGYMADEGRLPKKSVDTADLILFFDKLFDSVNGNFHKPELGKIYRCAVTRQSPHHRLWYKSLPILKSMTFITKTGNRATVPSLTSWVKSIEAFLALTKDLHSAGLKSILLRHINQDPLENFFGAIRAHGLRNNMPSAHAFINAYKSLLICNITSYKSVGANCEEDNFELLHSLKKILTENLPQPETSNVNFEIAEEHLCIREADVENLISNPENKEKCAAVAYCSGWLIYLLKKNIYKDCQTCRHDFESEEMQDYHKYIKIKEYDSTKTWLSYPSREAFSLFFNSENVVTKVLKTKCQSKNINAYLELVLTININYNFITCNNHRNLSIKYMLKKIILFFLNNWCKDINQLISGKTTFWDESDEMKVAAHNYYVTHKTRNKN